MGIAGKIAKAFIESKLTPLIVIASILTGIFALGVTPREEEPQILVPMVDVFVSYPGATAREVEERVTKPMTRLLWEIKGVEYIYSTSKPGMSLAIVRFYVGENMEDSLVKLYNKLMSNYDKIPPGVSQPLVKPKSIDDVPILTLTFWSKEYTGYELRRVAVEVSSELKKDKDVSEITVIGGQRRQFRIDLIPSRLKAYGVSPTQLLGILEGANFSLTAGVFPRENTEYVLKANGFIRDKEELGSVVVGVSGERPIYLRDVATIEDGPEEPAEYVLMGFGERAAEGDGGMYEAVTIAVAKKKGANAIEVANRMLDKIRLLKGSIIPQGIEITTTRNYGETAKEKSDELIKHMFIAAFSVTLLIAIALGWREAIVVAVAVPVTLALTIFVTYMFGYTLNRVTLFALIFSIGILVDDAIVVVENIHRHFAKDGVSIPTALAAVDEVGNPTILATFTVIAALLPMGFVSGLMGPYMRPIPMGASAAMLISLFIAFIISPWLSYIVLKGVKKHVAKEPKGHGVLSLLNRVYERNLRSLIAHRSKRITAFIIVGALFLGVILLIYFKVVTVKMLPFDNKSELQVIIDMPEGTTLEETAAVTRKVADYIRTLPEVENLQIYIGTASPFNFNGLVRHYFLRRGSNVSDVQVNLVPKDKRKAQSHDITKRIRPHIKKIGDEYGARIKIAEVPPGPPVLSTLVAEVYGPDYKHQIEIAEQIRKIFEETEGVVDV